MLDQESSVNGQQLITATMTFRMRLSLKASARMTSTGRR